MDKQAQPRGARLNYDQKKIHCTIFTIDSWNQWQKLCMHHNTMQFSLITATPAPQHTASTYNQSLSDAHCLCLLGPCLEGVEIARGVMYVVLLSWQGPEIQILAPFDEANAPFDSCFGWSVCGRLAKADKNQCQL